MVRIQVCLTPKIEFRYAYIPEWKVLDSFNQMAQMSSSTLTVPEEVRSMVHREPKEAILQAITSKIADMTKDFGATGTRRHYDCVTVPKWTLDEVSMNLQMKKLIFK